MKANNIHTHVCIAIGKINACELVLHCVQVAITLSKEYRNIQLVLHFQLWIAISLTSQIRNHNGEIRILKMRNGESNGNGRI